MDFIIKSIGVVIFDKFLKSIIIDKKGIMIGVASKKMLDYGFK